MVDPLMLAPLRKVDVRACPHTLAQAAAIARVIVERSGLASAFEWSLTARTGHPRKVSWETILVVMVVAGILAKPMEFTAVAGVATDLSRNNLISTDVSYWQLWDNVHKFVAALDDPRGGVVTAHNHTFVADQATGDLEDCPDGCLGGRRITRELFAALLLVAASYPPGTDVPTTVFAVDSTDHETWGKRRSWDRLPDIDTSDGAEHPNDVHLEDDQRDTAWPRRGADGRAQHTVDPDAREGYRSGKNLHRKEVFIGYDLHIVTPVPEFGDSPVPNLAVALATAPAGSSKSTAGLAALDSLDGLLDVQMLLADRGYTHLRAETWAIQLAARHVDTVFDLQTDQMGIHPGPIPGTIWVDGGLFTDALPEHLRKLGRFTLQMTGKQKAALHAQYDQRIPYAYAYFGRPDPVTGARRVRGPALRHLLRCPNDPQSMRLSKDRPTTTCPKPKPTKHDKKPKASCGCSKTVTLQVDEHAWTKQIDILWGTTEHAASYGRRVGVESLNSDTKSNRGIHLHRGFTRVRGVAMNHALLVFTLVGVDVRHLRDWHTRRLLADPWMTAIGDTSDPDWAAKHAHRKRKPRRMSLHERIIRGVIPGTRATGPRNRKSTRSLPNATVVATSQALAPGEQPLRT